jgi:hypothetical protein
MSVFTLSPNILSLFDLEHRLQYLTEVYVGDEVHTYNRFLGRGEK